MTGKPFKGLHFTTFVNILPKLGYFEGRDIYKLIKRVFQYFCFLDRPIKGGDILDFWKGGNLRKGGVGDMFLAQCWRLELVPGPLRFY